MPACPGPRVLGLKPEHYGEILAAKPAVGFFEIHAENYMGAGGPPHRWLDAVRERLSAVAPRRRALDRRAGPLDRDHLRRLRRLVDRYRPESFSEHLAWSTHEDAFLNDLLPLPYTPTTLARSCEHVAQTQDALGVAHAAGEPLDLRRLRGVHHRRDRVPARGRASAPAAACCSTSTTSSSPPSITASIPTHYLARFPLERVGEIHLGGYAETRDDDGEPLLIDAHGSPVSADVFSLYERTLALTGPVPTLVEWDNDVPSFATLLAEAQRVEDVLRGRKLRRLLPGRGRGCVSVLRRTDPDTGFADGFAAALVGSDAPEWLRKQGGRPEAGRFRIYRNNVGVALATALENRFPVLRRLVGEDCFAAMAQAYASARRPRSPVMLSYGDELAAFIEGEGFPAVSSLPYLADVARLEAAVTDAYHAAEAPVADLAVLASLAPEALDRARLCPHPAVRILSSPHPVGTIWSAHQADSVAPVERWVGETVLMARPHADVRLTILPPEDVPFMMAVLGGIAIGAAAETHRAMPDVGRALVALFQLGAVAALHTEETGS